MLHYQMQFCTGLWVKPAVLVASENKALVSVGSSSKPDAICKPARPHDVPHAQSENPPKLESVAWAVISQAKRTNKRAPRTTTSSISLITEGYKIFAVGLFALYGHPSNALRHEAFNLAAQTQTTTFEELINPGSPDGSTP